MTTETIVTLYAKVADISGANCKKTGCDGSCCSAEYCESTIQYAQESYGITLQPTGHAKLPMLDPVTNRCIAPPHTRPMCSLHNCDIYAVGVFRDNPKATKEYFKLRQVIDELEFERFKASDNLGE